MPTSSPHYQWRREETTSAGLTIASIVGLSVGLVVVAAMIAVVYVIVKRFGRRKHDAALRERGDEGMMRMLDTADITQARPYHYIKRASPDLEHSGTAPLLGGRSSQHWAPGSEELGRSQEFGRMDEQESESSRQAHYAGSSVFPSNHGFGASRFTYPSGKPSKTAFSPVQRPTPGSPSHSVFSVAGVREALTALPSIRASSLRVAIPLAASSPSTVAPYSAYAAPNSAYSVLEDQPPMPALPPSYDSLHGSASTRHDEDRDYGSAVPESTAQPSVISKSRPKYRRPSLKLPNFVPSTSVQDVSPSSLTDVTSSSGPPPSRTSVPVLKGPRPLRRPDEFKTPPAVGYGLESSASTPTLINVPGSSRVPVLLSAGPPGPSHESAWPSSPSPTSIYSDEALTPVSAVREAQ